MAIVKDILKKYITIEQHILNEERIHPEATGALTSLLYDLALAGKLIASQTTQAGLVGVLGSTGEINVQGEEVKKLDQIADETIASVNRRSGRLAAMASEEHENIIVIPPDYVQGGKYILLFDPLDGSSNINYNVSIGTIFAIYERKSDEGEATVDDCLQKGRDLVAAGYLVYGPSTMLVYSVGHGVHGFTLDPVIGEFLLSHPDMKYPDTPEYYCVNQGNQDYWTKGVRRYTRYLQGREGDWNGLSQRYIGALMADFHRTILAGGVYYYPADKHQQQGKLRLAYEAAPLAYLAEQAGGYASDGEQNILDIQPVSLHQRTPLFIGNRDLVEKAEAYIRQYDN